ncbi:MAG: IS66 family insertion sequence element accessory protein TnpB [Deltaproteobacteria bacterium]|nr:IS66 family insertion sequence element accessory protein TnpB [Deltaproteobacteria bacterium]
MKFLNTRIFVCTQTMDMRKQFDGLAAAAQEIVREDPLSGALFVFGNKRGNRLKVLWWDKTGYALLSKRLHRAVFRLPSAMSPEDAHVQVDALELQKILEGISLPPKKRRTRY